MGGLRHRAEHCARVAAALRRAAAEVVGGSGGAPRVVAQGHAGGSGPWTGSGPRRWWWGIRTEVGVHGVRATGHLVYPVAWVPDVGESVAGLGGARQRRGRRWSCAGRRGRPGCGPWPPGCRTGTVPHRSPTAPWAVARAGARGGRERRAGAAGVEDDPLDVRGVCPGPCDRPRVRRTAARCGGVREWRAGHSPSGGRPGLAGLVREVLAGLGGTAWRRTRAPLRADSCAGAPQGEGGRRRGLGGGRGAGRRLPPEDPRPGRSPPIPTPPAPGGRPPLTRSSARPATGARGAARRHPRTRCRTSFVRRSKVVRSRASALRRRRGSVLEGRRLNHQSGVVTVRPSRVSAVAPGWSA